MTGHLLARLWCRLRGHADRIWTVNTLGGGWTCARCLHWAPSVVRHLPVRPAPAHAPLAPRADQAGHPHVPHAVEQWSREALAARLRALTLALETDLPASTREALCAQRRAINQEQLRRAVAKTIVR